MRRAPDGSLIREKTVCDPVGDSFALACTDQSRKAWFGNAAVEMPVRPVLWQKLKYHGLNGGQIVRGEYLYVSAMYCEALHREGELLVSVEWFCRYLFNMNVSACGGVVYATDHFAELSAFMAEIIKEQLL